MENRERWIDYIKLFACILVAAGHFFMSMTESGILPDTALQDWFIKTIYYFHVPLFFMCSGYLYQKKTKITSFPAWVTNIQRKMYVLGVPYFMFSTATWVLKNVFSGSVNTQNDRLLVTLFTKPSSPYWYLYTLFFIFLITPTFSGRKSALMGLMAAVALKYMQASGCFATNVYAITQTLEKLVWFVSGMCLSVFNLPEICWGKCWKNVGIVCTALFLSASCLNIESVSMSLFMGTLGLACVFLLVLQWNPEKAVLSAAEMLSQYTMAIYLMHTIFAAGIRALLMKLGITNAWIHVAAGLTASFAGPIIAAEIMRRMNLDFFIYPGKYMKKRT